MQTKTNNIDNDINDETLEIGKKDCVNTKQKMSKFEKIFWGTIAIFFLIYLSLTLLAHQNIKDTGLVHNYSEPVSKDIFRTVIKEIEIMVPDNTIIENLKNIKIVSKIKDDLTLELGRLDTKIDTQVDQAFSHVYSNIDTFLDFHYSVLGEYTELTAAATGEIEQTIEEKLFGKNLQIYLNEAKQDIDVIYQLSLKKHFKEINKQALDGVDKELNGQVLQSLSKDIELRYKLQGTKLGIIILSKIVVKIISKVSTKIITKTGTKIAAKVAAKLAVKSAAAGAGATIGLACGPGAWVCSPLAAGALWFTTDVVVVSGDEYFHRDEFKREIIAMIDKQKIVFSERVKKVYFEDFKEQSNKLILQYKNTLVKKRSKRKIKIKEKIKENL